MLSHSTFVTDRQTTTMPKTSTA